MNLWKKLFGKREKWEGERPTRPEVAEILRVRIPRSRHKDHARKSMRRGVQIARELAQRPFRLAAIAASQRQGIEVRETFRRRQLVKREVRVQLRAAATA